jgi:glutathione S-transferase
MTKPALYHCADARSFRCLWAAEEVGFDCDLKLLPFPPRVRSPEFKEINPLGTIPAWVEGDLLLTESAAICQRIAAGTPLEVMPDEAHYWRYLNWLHQSDATFTFPQTIVLRYRVFEPAKGLGQAADDYAEWFLGRMRVVEAALADGREFLCAGRFTIADICVGYAVLLARSVRIADGLGLATLGWYERLKARPGFQAAKARQRGEPSRE